MEAADSTRRQFASDNYSGICPEVWQALEEANCGHTPGYGEDPWTHRARKMIRDVFERDCEVSLSSAARRPNWLAVPAFRRLPVVEVESAARRSAAWARPRSAVNALRLLQNADGSVPGGAQLQAEAHLSTAAYAVAELRSFFPHQELYLAEMVADLRAWAAGGFGKPGFGRSLAAFNPQKHRVHNREHLVFLPLYTPNASSNTRFEELIMRTPWPEWLAALERELYPNERFVPGHLVDYSAGFESQCAVLFPEMVSLKSGATNNFAIIFCDREAQRLQKYKRWSVKTIRSAGESDSFFALSENQPHALIPG